MIIKIRKRSQNKILIWILFAGAFFLAPVIQFFHFPSFTKYILDITWFLLLMTMLFKKKQHISREACILKRFIIMFFVLTVIVYLFNFQSIFYYLWSFRNNFRGYVIFMAAVYYFNQDDISDIFKFLNLMFYTNTIIMVIQFGVLGYKQDNLGGIFGVETGCNAYINIFFCIILVINYVAYFRKEINLGSFIFKACILLILSGMAELKFFYIEFVVLIVVGFFVVKGQIKKLLICVGGILILSLGLNTIRSVFPDIEMGVMELIDYATSTKGYTSSGDLNRLFFFSQVDSLFLTTPLLRIFGLGLGNCDYATGISFLTSPFAEMYQDRLHYGWMSTAFMYLEAGYMGLIFLFGFFILICIFCYVKHKRESNVQSKDYYSIGFLLGIVAIMNGFYNISLRIESCYIIYLLLAVPFIKQTCNKNY